MNTGRCIKQAPYTMLMIQVRSHVFILTYKIHFRRMVIFRSKCDRALVNPFDQVIDFKEGHDLVTYNSNGWSMWTLMELFSTSCQIDVTVYPYDTVKLSSLQLQYKIPAIANRPDISSRSTSCNALIDTDMLMSCV
jgi:hypothetical protein